MKSSDHQIIRFKLKIPKAQNPLKKPHFTDQFKLQSQFKKLNHEIINNQSKLYIHKPNPAQIY